MPPFGSTKIKPYIPFPMCMPTGAVAQWYTYSPGFSVLKLKTEVWPGAVNDEAAPPPGPVTACKSILWGILESGLFDKLNSTSSPSRTRINCPGTCPPKVQNI